MSVDPSIKDQLVSISERIEAIPQRQVNHFATQFDQLKRLETRPILITRDEALRWVVPPDDEYTPPAWEHNYATAEDDLSPAEAE